MDPKPQGRVHAEGLLGDGHRGGGGGIEGGKDGGLGGGSDGGGGGERSGGGERGGARGGGMKRVHCAYSWTVDIFRPK